MEQNNERVTNKIFTQGLKLLNSAVPVKRLDILKSFSEETIIKAWEVFSKYISKNYHSGKGTSIPKFGVFTFTANEVNLEGTTNQFQRDHKARKPVFIVSNDFVEKLKPGQSTPNGMVYYNQKQNNNMNHVKINYAEMAYSLNMKKEDCFTLIDNYIKFIGDSIVSNEFKSKEMPSLGTLCIKNNIICVKFLDDIVEQVKFIPQKLLTTKKHVNLYMEVNHKSIENNNMMKSSLNRFQPDPSIETIKNLPEVSKRLVEIRPKTAIITKISEGAEKWLKNNLDIDLREIENEDFEKEREYNSIKSKNEYQGETGIKLINDFPEKPLIKANQLNEMNIKAEILDSIYFHKGVLISELRAADVQNTGLISFNEIVLAFVKANIHPELTSQLISDIVLIYNQVKSDKIDYMKLISYFLRDLKTLIELKATFNQNSSQNFNSALSRPNTTAFGSLMPSNNHSGKNFSKTGNGFYNSNSSSNAFPKLNLQNSIAVNSSNNNFYTNTNTAADVKTVFEKKVELDDIKNEIKTIKLVFDKIKLKSSTRMDQTISSNEFSKILRDFSIVIPVEKINQMLTYLEINPFTFSLNEFSRNLQKCKILASEISTEETINIFIKLKDIIYTLGGEAFFFGSNPSPSETLSKKKFVSKLKSKEINVNYSEEILEAVFNFLTKTERNMTLDEFRKHFYETKTNDLSEEFENQAINTINAKIIKMAVKVNEYYDQLLLKKPYRMDNNLTRLDLHRVFSIDGYSFSAEEIDYLFKRIDSKNDGVIDREEFLKFVNKVHNALYKIKDIIKKEKLEIEDLLYKMIIDRKKEKEMKRFDLLNFKMKLKLLDSTFSPEFLNSLFNEMKEAGTNYVTLDKMLKEFDVYKREDFNENNMGVFRRNFIETFRTKSDYYEVKALCEKLDSFSNGLLPKIEFCNVLRKFSLDFEDEEIMKFLRVSNLLQNNKVKYPEFLDFIYYNPKADQFSEIIEILKNLYKESNYEIEALMAKITGEEYVRALGKVSNLNLNSKNTRSISISQMFEFLKKNFPEIKNLNKNIVCKLDLDLDGKISVEDLSAVIERYINTFFFKRENNSNKLEVNLYPSESIDEEKFKLIVKDIKAALKAKNLTELGLFNKLDTNKDGFITHAEFNKKIDEIIKLAPGMKDKFFSFLDIRSLGLVDLDTFMKRFKEFKSSEVIANNSWDTEQWILRDFSHWLKQNHRVSENELFTALDYDSDGIIGPNDFKKFILERLNFSQFDFNDFQLERVLQHISLTKNKNICLVDLHEFILKNQKASDEAKPDYDLVQTAKNLKESKEWINNVFEKIGSYIYENYKDIDSFFAENSVNGRMRLEDLQNYLSKNHRCLEGFNLTYDEIVTLFSALDGHKKTYILLEDLKSKLGSFDFYTKMHLDIKNFISSNFANGLAAFKYFTQQRPLLQNLKGYSNSSNIENHLNAANYLHSSENYFSSARSNSNNLNPEIFAHGEANYFSSLSLTKKEIFDGINNLFPKKYVTPTILNYFKKNFKNIEEIPFSEFNYVYFDDIKLENEALRKTFTSTKNVKDKPNVSYTLNNHLSKSVSDFRSMSAGLHMITAKNSKLETPFDDDPLEKIRRIIHASRFDFTNYFKMHELLSNNGMINTAEFKNMLKKMNIGLTSIEIDQIAARSGKTRSGMINIKDFCKFLKNEDQNLVLFKKNISQFMGLLKQLIYKYYSNARLAFQFNDQNVSKELDFNRFKQIIMDLFEKDSRPAPNYTLIKNAFEYIDIRKDGLIDMNEWLKAFTFTESSLDLKMPNLQNNLKATRSWENSKEISEIYYLISRNKKQIKDQAKDYLIKQGQNAVIHADNLVDILSRMFTSMKLDYNKWKLIVNIADKDKNSMIDLDFLFNLVVNSNKLSTSHPRI